MMKFGLIFLAVIVIITASITIFFTMKSLNNVKVALSYNSLFSSFLFRIMSIDSKLSKKKNSPFLEDDTLTTIKKGSLNLNLKGNIFGEIKDYDSKPKW